MPDLSVTQVTPDRRDVWLQPSRDAARHGLACQRADPELWFSALPAHLELAKAQCRPCPVRAACLAGAVERREPCGVWGGEIFDNGVIIGQKRSRGRPRKEAHAA